MLQVEKVKCPDFLTPQKNFISRKNDLIINWLLISWDEGRVIWDLNAGVTIKGREGGRILGKRLVNEFLKNLEFIYKFNIYKIEK